MKATSTVHYPLLLHPPVSHNEEPSNEIGGAENFSVYHFGRNDSEVVDNPLRDLLPEDNEHGWPVSRNLLKPLNHLDFLRKKEVTAIALNLHNVFTKPDQFDANYVMLVQHQSGEITTKSVVEHLTEQLQASGKPISHADVMTMLREYVTVRHMEFHPSDVCNLACRGCTYGHDIPELKPPPVNFPLDDVVRIAQLKPQSMVIIGGGEPTLYRFGKFRFQELIEEIRLNMPNVKLALVTNGTHVPKGNWQQWFSWIRVSLDAATPDTYLEFRRKPLFKRVVQNYLSYLDSDVPYVGISFLFSQCNIKDYAAVAKFIFDLVNKEKPALLHKVNVQYRPLRRDPYRYDRPFAEAISSDQIGKVVQEILDLADSSPKMRNFLKYQTNVTAVLGGNSHPPHLFSRCYYSQTFRILRANGDLRPCFIRVTEPDFLLGNIAADSLERIALNALCVAAANNPYCDARGCRQCHVNHIFEKALCGELQPSTSPEVLSDPMY